MYGFSKYDAQDRYDSYNTVQVKLKLNMKTDADILAGSDSTNMAGTLPSKGPSRPDTGRHRQRPGRWDTRLIPLHFTFVGCLQL